MSYRIAIAGLVVLLAGAAVCTAAHAGRQTPQWSVTFDNANDQFAASIVVGTRATSDGITINLLRSAASLTTEGVRQWRMDAAGACPPNAANDYVDAVERLPNGESWVLRSCYGPDWLLRRHELVRLAADGGVLVTTKLGNLGPSSSSRLIAQSDSVVALVAERGRLRWLRVTSDGAVVDDAYTELIGPPNHATTITNARLWPNGSASVATWQFFPCNISPPTSCPRPASTLLRLNVDGTERWRVEAGEFLAFVGFEEDGSSLIAQSAFDRPLYLRRVSATGVADTPFVAAGGEPINLTGAAGPVHGRYFAHSRTENLLIDRNGTVLVRRLGESAGGTPMANGEHGFITGVWQSDGALVSADDLSVLATFDVDGIDNTFWASPANQFWSLLDDGTVYSSSRARGDTLTPQRARISRFAVPGSPAADVIFISRFD